MSPASLRQVAAFSLFAFFCIYLFSSGTVNDDIWRFTSSLRRTPDFSRFTPPRVLSEDEFPLHDPHRRVVVVGDVHGMEKPFRALLDKLSFDPSSDILLHVGDIIAKGPHEGSMAVLSYMAQNNITGVRGNHDQKVIEWRSWLEWIRGIDGGKRFLTDFHAKVKAASPDDPEEWAEKHIKKIAKPRWRRKIPHGWKILSDHYRIARAMSDAEYRYLLSLPLVLHVPTAHTFIAHAGVLPSDPRYAPYHRRQPLARIPVLPHGVKHDKASPEKTLPLLRRLQETAVLTDVAQNTDPWVTLNMRGVLADHTVTRSKDGEPWSDVWNHDIDLCEGFDQHMHLTKHSKTALPCYPATVVYGHAASRGLDVKRWSIGLDSGCVYNHRLSSLVIESKFQKSLSELADEIEVEDIEARKKLTIPFGDGKARIIDITCQ